jgi:hypothetical protein
MLYDRTLVQIRERPFLDLLDLSLHVIRAKPLELALPALIGIAPWAVLNGWLLSDPGFPTSGWLVLLMLEVPWATAPLTLVIGDLMFGIPAKPHRLARTMLVSLPALILSQLIVRGLLLLCVVTYPVMPAQYPFLNEVILLERSGPLRQFTRSMILTRDCGGELFMRWLGQIVLGAIFAVCVLLSVRTIGGALIGDELTWYSPGMADRNGLVFQAAVWIAVAFFGVYRFFSYIDRRIRLEGWELDLRLKAVARGLEGRGGS